MGIDYSYIHDSIRQKVIDQQNARHFDDRHLKIDTYVNAIVMPKMAGRLSGLCVNNNIIRYSHIDDDEKVYAEERVNDVSIAESVDEEVVYLGELYNPWGHCITDNLSRAWPLLMESMPYKRMRVIYIADSELPENFIRMYELLGLKRECLCRICMPTFFKKVHFPERSFWHNEEGTGDQNRYYTKEFIETVEKIRNAVQLKMTGRSRRIYLSRCGWKVGCVDFGEEVVQKAFQMYYRCEPIHPEQLSFEGMIQLLYDSELVVTTEGSISHNALFGPDSLQMVILRKSNLINYHQPVINEIRGLNVKYVDIYANIISRISGSRWTGPFYLFVGRHLARFLHCPQKFSFYSFLRYCKCILSVSYHAQLDRYFANRDD